MPAITLPDGTIRSFDGAVTGTTIAAAIGPGLAKAALAMEVNGKLRDRADVAPDMDEDALIAMALSLPKVQAAMGDAEPKRTIVVPGKLVNVVVGGK